MKPCNECKFFDGECTHKKLREWDAVDGYVNSDPYVNRKYYNKCNPSGYYWERKLTFFQRLFR